MYCLLADQLTPCKALPYSKWDSPNPEDLWAYLEAYREMTGSDVISIPHNSNVSRGNMFMTVTYEGKPVSPDYARIRSSIEPIIEVTQIKGDSETHPLISPNDDFADYEPYRFQFSIWVVCHICVASRFYQCCQIVPGQPFGRGNSTRFLCAFSAADRSRP